MLTRASDPPPPSTLNCILTAKFSGKFVAQKNLLCCILVGFSHVIRLPIDGQPKREKHIYRIELIIIGYLVFGSTFIQLI